MTCGRTTAPGVVAGAVGNRNQPSVSLNQLRTKLKKSAAKPDFVFTDAQDYYKLPGVEATMVKGQLIIQIPVMLRSEDQDPAVLHVVDRVWVPVANEMGLYTRV